MTVGYRNASGTDLDSLFLARATSPISNTGFRDSSGVDLASRYQGYVGGAKVATTGFRNSSGADFADLFQNISVPLVQLQSNTYERFGDTPAQFSFSSSGSFQLGVGTSGTTYSWLVAGSSSSWDLYVEPFSGSFSSGAVNAWVNLGSTRTYTRTATPGTIQSVSANVYLAPAGTGSIVASATIGLVCDRSF